MLQQNDLLLLLRDLEKDGVDVADQMRTVVTSPAVSIGVIKFINDHRPLEVTKFYEQLRKSYNAHKSSLYYNIVKEVEATFDVLTTLSSLNLQILLFAKHLDDKDVQMFLSHSRAEEITRVLNNYYKTFDLRPCIELLRLVRTDCKIFQTIKK